MTIPPVIVWIPSHVGFQEHDVADQQAKEALALSTVSRFIYPNLEEATDRIKCHYRTMSESAAKDAVTGRSYYTLFPKGKNKLEILSPRNKDVVITLTNIYKKLGVILRDYVRLVQWRRLYSTFC